MPESVQDRITAILTQAETGAGGTPTEAEPTAPLDRLLPVVYTELRAMAGRRLAEEHGTATLSPTELVHEAYLRLADSTHITDRGRAYFFAAAARAMRRILVDHARHRGRLKRGGGAQAVTLHDTVALTSGGRIDILDLEDGLERLASVAERAARVVEYRFYGGLSVADTAVALDVTSRTVDRDWRFARAWLFDHLRGAEPAS